MPQERKVTTVQPRQLVSKNYVVVEHLARMPNLIARGLFYVTMLLVAAAVLYACLAKVDVVVTCRARARPASHKTKVLSDRSGYIARIHVTEGGAVEKDDPLFTIRSKETVTYQAKIEELRRTIPLTKQSYETKAEAAKGKLARCDSQHKNAMEIVRLKAEQNGLSIASVQSEIEYWDKEVQRQTKHVARVEQMREKNVATLQEVDEARGALARARSEASQRAAKKSIALKEKGILQRDLAEEMSNHKEKRGTLEKDLLSIELEQKTTLQSMQSELKKNEKMLAIKGGRASTRPGDEDGNIIRADEAGTVSELCFRKPGEYVRESDVLCTIVPAGSPLYMDIVVANRDVGFIREGMTIRYKVDAFPYSDYGTLDGTVAAIPPSAVEDSEMGFVYSVRGTLNEKHFEIKGTQYPVKAGMTATAELITEEQTIISHLLRKR